MGKIKKYSGLIYGENLWGKLMVEICGENLWGKFMEKIYGENLWGKFMGIYGKNYIYCTSYLV